MQKFTVWLVLILLVVPACCLLYRAGNYTAFGVLAGISLLSVVFYMAVTRPKKRVKRMFRHIDEMNGEEFELFVADLLQLCGYRKVQVTAATGDYGADLVALQKGQIYIFQCKRYAKNCGVQAVQEICGAKAHYNSDMEVVVTNGHFTKNAAVLAEETGVELWDREVLQQLMLQYG